jgi:hypothetical protein
VAIEKNAMLRDVDLMHFVNLALACVHREYPYHMVHLVNSPADVRAPRELNPAFYGCFDWHSAMHTHWLLVRCVRFFPEAPWARTARDALARTLTEETLAKEVEYFRAPHREGFERPYGLAWVLQLATELRGFEPPELSGWLHQLEQIAVERMSSWLPKLPHPIRSGEHSQTAFSMGLSLDYARAVEDTRFEQLLVERAIDFYGADVAAPLAYEPSAHDFLSPAIAEADLMRRVLAAGEFSSWLSQFLPQIPWDASTGWLLAVQSTDPADGKLSHLSGLNLTRAWMLDGIAAALPEDDLRSASLLAARDSHAAAGLGAISAVHFSGAHWLGSFAVYLLTHRGISP